MVNGVPGNPPPLPNDPALEALNFEQLAQLVNEISPEVFYQRAAAFDRAAARLQDAVERIRRELNVLREAWTGTASEDFGALAQGVSGRTSDTVQAMLHPGYGAVLRAAGDALAAHQRRMRDLQAQKSGQDSAPPAPGAPPPEARAQSNLEAARQILRDLRTAYWDAGNQFPVLPHHAAGPGGGSDTGNGGAPGGGPVVTNVSVHRPGGGDGATGGDGGGDGRHESRGQYGGDQAPFSTMPLGTTGSHQGPARRAFDHGGAQPGDGIQIPWRTAGPEQWSPFGTPKTVPLSSGPEFPPGVGEPHQVGDLRPVSTGPLVVGRSERRKGDCSPEEKDQPGVEKQRRNKVIDSARVDVIDDGNDRDQAGEVKTAPDSPRHEKHVTVESTPNDKPKVVTSAGPPAPPSPAKETVEVPVHATSTGTEPPVVQAKDTAAHQSPPAPGGGGGAAGSQPRQLTPEERGMFTPGNGGGAGGTLQSAVPPANSASNAVAPNQVRGGPADSAASHPGGMPMSPMMGGMGGQGAQQTSRMAAMPTEARPDAWPTGGGSAGTLGKREPEPREDERVASDEKALMAEKFAELDRLLERGK